MNNSKQIHNPLERLSGSVERVTFHSEDSGFCVLRTKVKGHRDLVTVIGNTASIAPGEYVECTGVWVNNKKHGLQFKAVHLKTVPPTTLYGIEKYLGSGMIKGIGPHFAKKLVRAFGDEVFDVIEKQSERLRKVDGIGKKRQEQIINAWGEQKIIRNIMVFLQSYGIGTARSVRIYKTYGDAAIEQIRENPYRLCLDIRGIGFRTADELAKRLGIATESMMRAQAGVRHVLQELCDHGHCAAEYTKLVIAAEKLLEINAQIIQQAIQLEIKDENLVADTIQNRDCVFLMSLYRAEQSVAQNLLRINKGCIPWGDIDLKIAIPWVEGRTGLKLSESQQEAVRLVCTNKITIITGGPGVGKTTVVNSILQVIKAKKVSIALCAPTGRAAKRLTETTGIAAKTIHRLLAFDPKSFGFKHNQNNPLPIDFLVVDEASMIDVVLMHHLLKAIPDHAAILIVGDVDQLPSVGAGAVLHDLIISNAIPTIYLTEIFRQAATSQIIVNAHRINVGKFPLDEFTKNTESDFYIIYADEPEEIHDKLLHIVTERIPQRFNYDPKQDIQVLTPMHRGGLGSRALNISLQECLNAISEPKIKRYGWTFAPGDKVIQNVNNYDKEVFNGDIGLISSIDIEESILKITFGDRDVEYGFCELDEIALAYATSIHKSQGSEYPVVVMPLATQHYVLLARNLLYTGVTRGKKLVVLIGQKKAISMAVNNNRTNKRLTKLAEIIGVRLVTKNVN